jgi:non-specific serine/threonine protein kinase
MSAIHRPLSAEAIEVRDRHLDYFLAFAEEAATGVLTPRRGEWIEDFQAEQDNLRSALAWGIERHDDRVLRLVVAAEHLWSVSRIVGEARQWLERVLAAVPQPTPERVEALTALADLHESSEVALGWAEEAIAVGRVVGDPEPLTAALTAAGWIAFRRGQPDRARVYFEEVRLLGPGGAKHWVLANAVRGLGWIALRAGDLDEARRLHAESGVIARSSGSPGTLIDHLTVEANLLHQAGDL